MSNAKNLTAAEIKIVVRLAKAMNNMARKDAAYDEGRCTQEVRDNAEVRLMVAQTEFDKLGNRVDPMDVFDIARMYG